MTGKIYTTIGPPGTGKTTTLSKKATEAAHQYGSQSVLITSLTKAAAVEAAGREIPIHKDRIGTLHAHAYRALGAPAIAEGSDQLKEFAEYAPVYAMSPGPGVDLGDSPEEMTHHRSLGDDMLGKYQLLRAKMTPREKWPVEVDRFGTIWEQFKADNDYLDFEDLIEVAATDVRQAPGGPRVIYGDEAQDWSRSEYHLCLKWAEEAHALVLFGDWDQSLYVWRGADPNILKTLDIPDSRRRVLSQSYRVPRAVHKVASRWIRRIKNRDDVEYLPRDEEGEVRELHSGFKFPRPLVVDCDRYLSEGKTVLFLASCSFMLRPLIHELRDAGIPFHNPYRKKNGAWNPMRAAHRLLEFLRPDPATWGDKARPWTWKEVGKWIEIVDAKSFERGMKSSILKTANNPKLMDLPVGDNLLDAIDSVDLMFNDDIDFWQGGDPGALKSLVMKSKRHLLEYPVTVAKKRGKDALRAEPRVIVSTVHGIKGGEADVVYVFPDLSLAGFSKWEFGTEDRDAVRRLFYVAFTRAKESLILCDPSGRNSVDWRS